MNQLMTYAYKSLHRRGNVLAELRTSQRNPDFSPIPLLESHEENRKAIIITIKEMNSNDEVNLYINGLISVGPDVRVCKQAFASLHGRPITQGKVDYQFTLIKQNSPHDLKGRH
ncbi:hypothetical protein PR048_010960 [Dryococelus australis]|uniref:Uncharacterized protein n=1 Tax=Dryococelus australis TaxID=614101 RepID=A0ABQ9HK97_9NEOP|nr:hypothetical protein PR048_010960 [Dryococelus australis]